MAVVLRRIVEADVPALVALYAAVEAVDNLGEHVGGGSAPRRIGARSTNRSRCSPPAGYVVRACATGDGERLRRAHNRAFVDHPNPAVWTPEEWEAVMSSEAFRPAVTFLLTAEGDPDTIVSYITTHEYAARQQATGRREACIARVGTLPARRGRGLAGWLLRHCLAAYRSAGYDEAVLGVDSENPTGALGLYERAGFVAERQFTQYLLQLP